MNYKKISIMTYIAVLVACIYSCSDYMIKASAEEYTQVLSEIRYQMDYSDVYSVGIYNKSTQETVAKTDSENILDEEKKIIYLTFDDGPSPRTSEILDVLKEYNIPATFFVVCSEKDSDRDLIVRAAAEGHTIGVHSASHAYNKIYKSVDSFLADFEICFNYIYKITDTAPTIFRFPGGSVNSYNKAIRTPLTQEMKRRGFTYFDWNVSAGDAEKGSSVDRIVQNILNGCKKHKESVVLLHDSGGKKDTVTALKQVLPQLIKEGYSFKNLDEPIKPIIFKIN